CTEGEEDQGHQEGGTLPPSQKQGRSAAASPAGVGRRPITGATSAFDRSPSLPSTQRSLPAPRRHSAGEVVSAAMQPCF
ncbi:unnamed protein product, partial [Ixodes persulcatus]